MHSDHSYPTGKLRIEELAPVCIWNGDQEDSYSPAYDEQVRLAAKIDFHAGVDFLDPLADGLEKLLQSGSLTRTEKLNGLQCFFYDIVDDDPSSFNPIWRRANVFFVTLQLTGIRDLFLRRTKEVSAEIDLLALESQGDPPRSPTVDDMIDLGLDAYIADLRCMSAELKGLTNYKPAKDNEESPPTPPGIAAGTDLVQKTNKTTSSKGRGRTKADYFTVQREAKLAAEWELARDAKISKSVFAKDSGMELYVFQRLLDRVRHRNKPLE